MLNKLNKLKKLLKKVFIPRPKIYEIILPLNGEISDEERDWLFGEGDEIL